MYQDEETWKGELAARVKALEDCFKAKHPSTTVTSALDKDAFEAEVQGCVEDEAEDWIKMWPITAVQTTDWQKKFGDPLDSVVNEERYGLWAAFDRKLPLLAFVAKMVLCARVNAVPNEELHSAAGLVFSKLRARLKPATAEKLTLARKLMMARLEKDELLKKASAARDEVDGVIAWDDLESAAEEAVGAAFELAAAELEIDA